MSEVITTKPVFTNRFKILNAANDIQPLTDNSKLTFTKLWVYPAKGHAEGKLTANVGNVYVGKKGSGDKVTPDTLAPGDLPLKIELEPNQSLRVEDVVVQADNANDGVFLVFT